MSFLSSPRPLSALILGAVRTAVSIALCASACIVLLGACSDDEPRAPAASAATAPVVSPSPKSSASTEDGVITPQASSPSATESSAPGAPASTAAASSSQSEGHAPELVPIDVDYFHPDHQPGPDGRRPPQPEPAFGGRVIVRTDLMPPSLNYALDGAAVTRRILYEVHETLLAPDFETGELVPDVAERWDVEDTLISKPTEDGAEPRRWVGVVTREGDEYVVRPVSPLSSGPAGPAAWRVPAGDVASLERGTVLTFHLRRDVRWHDGEPFDASDVAFSFSIYANPKVRCDNKRPNYSAVTACEVLDPYTVRFTLAKAHFKALGNVADLFLMPAHRYDLSDPDHARFDPDYVAAKRAQEPQWQPTADEQAEYVNAHPANRAFVGLGPYRVTEWTQDHLEATRFDGYFAPERGGYVDTIRWRLITNDDTANEALLSGDIDYNDRLTSEQYFGAFTRSEAFLARCYKGHLYADTYGFVAWNMTRPKFSDARVRRALGMLFDYEGVRANYYRGHAIQVTGVQPVSSPAYDWSLVPLKFDPAAADALLTEAGWIDRDGDGVRDKDGQPFEFEIAINTGSRTSETLMARFQEELAKQGVRARVQAYDWSVFQERCVRREYDAAARGWVPPPEVDPDALWHSRWAGADVGASNFCGFADPEVDRLIDAGVRELDDARRYAIWRELGARIYAAQPYTFLFNPARKFAVSKALRGFQALRFDPNYQIRRWYYPKGTPGTRATREPAASTGGESRDSSAGDR